MDVQIEEAGPTDLAMIQSLNKKLFEKELGDYDPSLDTAWPHREGEGYFRERILHDDGCALIAKENNNVIGYLVGGKNPAKTYRTAGALGELENMWVDESHRSQGIGTQLVQAFFAWCRKQGIRKVRVTAYAGNQRALTLYKRLGFKEYLSTLEQDL